MNKDVCDICNEEFNEEDLFSIEHWKDDKKKQRMDKTYMAAAFSWACEKCLMSKSLTLNRA